MSGPGTQPTNNESKKIYIESIGQVTPPPVQFEGPPRPLFKMTKKNGQQWSAFFVDPIGIQVISHQTQNTFTIDAKTLIDLALEAGVDDQVGTIIIPGSEVPRG